MSTINELLAHLETLDSASRADILENCIRNIGEQAARAGSISEDEITAALQIAVTY